MKRRKLILVGVVIALIIVGFISAHMSQNMNVLTIAVGKVLSQ